jgi:hypothetical protein
LFQVDGSQAGELSQSFRLFPLAFTDLSGIPKGGE